MTAGKYIKCKTMLCIEVIKDLLLYMIYQKFQKNEYNPNMKGLALCLAHDLQKGWMLKFQSFFQITYYIPLDS